MQNELVMAARLPFELLQLVIEEVANDLEDPESRVSLLSCTLVCRSFHYSTSEHLFSSIKILTKGDPADHMMFAKRLQDLHYILERNKTLGQRVKSLSIQTEFLYTSPPINPELILENPFLPLVLPRLSSISSFSWINRDGYLPWPLLSDCIAEGFKKLSDNLSLKALSFERIAGLPVNLFTRPPNLKCLRLIHVNHGCVKLEDQLISSQVGLHTFANHRDRDLYLHILANPPTPSMFSQLRVLDIGVWDHEEVRGAWALIVQAAQTLEVLTITNYIELPPLIPGPVDLGVLKRLRTVKIKYKLSNVDRIIFPTEISDLLRPPTSPCNIENVEITINWTNYEHHNENLLFLQDLGWRSLDEALSGSTFSQLRHVVLDLKLVYGWTTNAPPSLVSESPSHFKCIAQPSQLLATRHLPLLSRMLTVKTNIDISVYKNRDNLY